jgi:hypothetical protein
MPWSSPVMHTQFSREGSQVGRTKEALLSGTAVAWICSASSLKPLFEQVSEVGTSSAAALHACHPCGWVR